MFGGYLVGSRVEAAQEKKCQDTSFRASREVEEIRSQVVRSLAKGAVLEARRTLRRSSLSIPLGPARAVEAEQARRDVGREPTIYLNGVRFAGPEDVFLDTIRRVSRALGGCDGVADTIVRRAARTSAGADSYFVLRWLLGLDDDDDEEEEGGGGGFNDGAPPSLTAAKDDSSGRYVVMPRTRLTEARPFSEVEDDEPASNGNKLRGLEIAIRRKVITTYKKGGSDSSDRTIRLAARIACRNSYAVLDMHSILNHQDMDSSLSSTSSRTARRQGSENTNEPSSPRSDDSDADERLSVVTTVIEDLEFDGQSGLLVEDKRTLEISLDGHRPPPQESRHWITGHLKKQDHLLSTNPSTGANLHHNHRSLDHPPLYRAHVV